MVRALEFKPERTSVQITMTPTCVHPESTTSGCYFHLKQSVLRKVQVCRLKRRYKQDLQLQTLVKCITAFAFVPPDRVAELFEDLSELFPDEGATDDLLTYFKSTYIQKPMIQQRQRSALFPPELLNHYDDSLQLAPKTTNCVEGWHNALKSLYMATHLSVWAMLRGLQKDIAIQWLVVIQADTMNSSQLNQKYKRLAEHMCNTILTRMTKWSIWEA